MDAHHELLQVLKAWKALKALPGQKLTALVFSGFRGFSYANLSFSETIHEVDTAVHRVRSGMENRYVHLRVPPVFHR